MLIAWRSRKDDARFDLRGDRGLMRYAGARQLARRWMALHTQVHPSRVTTIFQPGSVTSTEASTIAHSPSTLRRVTLESAVNKAPAVVWRLDHPLQTYAMALGINAVVVAGQKSAAAGQTAASFAARWDDAV